jgi:PAS domain S-box-containing protein
MAKGTGEPFYASANIDHTDLLAAIIESADECILSKDLEGTITSWNRACETCLGFTTSEAIGTSIYDMVPQHRHAEEAEIIGRISRGERIERYDTERIAKDGRIVPMLLTISPIRDTSGKIIGCSSIMHDITEQKREEERLKEEKDIVEAIHRIGTTLSTHLDVQEIVQAVTDAATELSGAQFGAFFYNVYDGEGGSYMLYTISGVPREHFEKFPMPRNTDIFGPTFKGTATIRLDDVKKDPRYVNNPPYNGMPEGHLPVTSYLAVPVISQNGDVIGGLFFGHKEPAIFKERHERIVEGLASQAAIAMDNARLYGEAQLALGERDQLLEREQRLREEAEAASRSKDEFLGLLSHELRTPLNSILGWSNTIKSGRYDEASLTRAIETIDRNARLQVRLIEDMLDVSRIVSGKLRLDAQPVDLTTVINPAVESLRPAAEAKQLRLYVVLNYGEGVVLGDPVRLQQVIWNLLSNAIKFTPKMGSITLSLERINSHFELTVSDTGPGIDPDFIPVIFDRFKQADSSTKKKHAGLGLGLAIVKQLVEMHGGTVKAENRSDVEGAIFTICLPVMAVRAQHVENRPDGDADQPSVKPFSAETELPDLTGVNVLVVDDELDARELLQSFLEHLGAVVATAESAETGLKRFTRGEVDVLVSDIGMPGEDGYSFMRKVRTLEANSTRHVPAIALTAYARSEDRMKALEAGFNMHVPKPVEPAELALVVASFTKRTGRPRRG